MKKLYFILISLIAINSFSQTKESLSIATKNIFEANYLMDYETVISFSYPKMVETIGKETLIEKLEKYYENEEFRLRFQLETVPFQFSEIKKINGKSFSVITCRNPIRYFFENKLSNEEAIAKANWLKEINQTKDVIFEPKRNSFNVKRTSTFVAVFDETTNGEWKFFNFDDNVQNEAFNTLFDENTKTALGLKK